MGKKPICGIYKITNQVNGKVYIGQSVNISNRWKQHKNAAFKESSDEYNYPLYQAIRKYGLENFTFEVIEECSSEDLNFKEEHYISLYESYPPDKGKGYNQTLGGNSGDHFGKLNQFQVLEIRNLLKNSKMFMKDIALKFDVTLITISDINLGKSYFDSKLKYPIRRKEESYLLNNCLICGAQLKYYKSKMCFKCAPKQHQILIPSKEDILKSFYELRNCQKVADKFNISVVLLKKWREELNLPEKVKDIVELYERECLGIIKEEILKRDTSPKIILKVDPITGNVIEEFSSAAEAGKAMDTTGWTIIQQCQKYPKIYKDYYWKFKIP